MNTVCVSMRTRVREQEVQRRAHLSGCIVLHLYSPLNLAYWFPLTINAYSDSSSEVVSPKLIRSIARGDNGRIPALLSSFPFFFLHFSDLLKIPSQASPLYATQETGWKCSDSGKHLLPTFCFAYLCVKDTFNRWGRHCWNWPFHKAKRLFSFLLFSFRCAIINMILSLIYKLSVDFF